MVELDAGRAEGRSSWMLLHAELSLRHCCRLHGSRRAGGAGGMGPAKGVQLMIRSRQ